MSQYYQHQAKAIKALDPVIKVAQKENIELDPVKTQHELLRQEIYVSQKWVKEYLKKQGITLNEQTPTI